MKVVSITGNLKKLGTELTQNMQKIKNKKRSHTKTGTSLEKP
jgi:hypothetical protein